MESFPTPENNNEKIPVSREVVIATIKEKGFADPEAKELLIEWTMQNEAEANEKNTARANIECALKSALLYEEIGDTEYAIECLYDCLDAAKQSGEEEIRREIGEHLDRLEA